MQREVNPSSKGCDTICGEDVERPVGPGAAQQGEL